MGGLFSITAWFTFLQDVWLNGWSAILDLVTLSGMIETAVEVLVWFDWLFILVFPADVTGYFDGARLFFAPPGASSSSYQGVGYVTIRLAAYFIDFIIPWVLVDITLGVLVRLWVMAVIVRLILWLYVKVWGSM